MKKIIFFLSIILLTSACGAVKNSQFETERFSIEHPKSWHQVSDANKLASLGINTEKTKLALFDKSNETLQVFTVIEEVVPKDIDEEQFLEIQIANAGKMTEYEQISLTSTKINNFSSQLHVFSGKDSQGKTVYFMQSYFLEAPLSYVFTLSGTMSMNVETQNEYQALLTSFELKKTEE